MRISGDLTEHPNVTWVWASLPLPPFRPYSPVETVLGPQTSQRFWKQNPKINLRGRGKRRLRVPHLPLVFW